MTSPHRFLSNDRNAALSAQISASSILPAEATAFPLPRDRQGTARAVLGGGYTGEDDALIEIEIVSASGTGLLSAPTFAGAGNGALSDLAADGVPAQTFILLLASTGTPTKKAAVDFYGVTLQAKAEGAAGNGIEIAVSAAGIIATPAVYSFLEAAKAGDSQFKGPQWDFGSHTLTADGEIDPRTPRLRFGNDPQVYRQYKTFADGDWSYVIDPPVVRDPPAETPVYALSGSYTITVTAGATVEHYPDITTLFDLLNALKTRSNLIEVIGVVVEDKTPGGMAAEDLPLRTDAYALPATYAGNAAFPGLGAVTVAPTAPTEIVTLTCADVSTLGGEAWSVAGSVSGALPDCVTGRAYSGGPYGFTVPRVIPPASEAPTGRIKVTDISLVSRGEDALDIELCVKPIVAGAKAKAKTIEVVYAKKPAVKDCKCENAPAARKLDFRCLGVGIEEGATMAIVAAYQTRLEDLYAFREQFVAGNTAISGGALRTVVEDVDLINRATDLFARCLDELFIGAGEPPAPALAEWNAALTDMASDLAALGNIQAPPGTMPRFEYGAFYEYGDTVLPPIGQHNGHTYKIKLGFLDVSPLKTGAGPYPPDYQQAQSFWADTAQPVGAWPIDGTVVSVSGYGSYPVFAGQVIAPVKAMLVDQGPYAGADATAGAGSATLAQTVEQFVQRYGARMDLVRAKAGIVPKYNAGKKGSSCWRECDGDYEWRVGGREYLPACTNRPYHSCVEKIDADGKEYIEATQEFGFVIRCACPDRLVPGDKFTVVIDNDAAAPKAYAVGDLIKIPVIAAAPLELAGGQDGDDTLTWTVRGSLGAAWPDYGATLGAEPVYDHNGLQFRIHQGGVPFALGDQFQFAVAGGTFKWRQDGGAWSTDQTIGVDPVALADSLSLTIKPGPAPAFVAGDTWAFDVMQPHAPKLAKAPDGGAWRWEGPAAIWEALFSGYTALLAVAIWHDCPAGASFGLVGFDAADGQLWAKAVPYRPGLAVAIFEGADAVAECRKLWLAVSGAAGGSVRWIWCGVPWAPECEAASIRLRESWLMRRGAQSARLTGRGGGGEIRWSAQDKAWLESADWEALIGMLDHVKSCQDEPVVFLPNADYPAEARLVRLGDELDAVDWRDFQFLPERALDVQLSLSAVPL